MLLLIFVQELAGRSMSLPCDVTSLPHRPLIGRDESRDEATVAGGRGSWRCDVCGYSTMVARNLRIHMTSEKHAHNMAALQHQSHRQQIHLQQHLNAAAAVSGTGYHPSLPPWPPFLCPPQRSVRAATTSSQQAAGGGPGSEVSGRGCGGGGGSAGTLYTCNLCPYRTSLRANFHLHCQTDKHAQRVRQLTAAALTALPGGVVDKVPAQSVGDQRPPSTNVDDDNYDHIKPRMTASTHRSY